MNALRHGLTIPAIAIPEYHVAISQAAHKIAGPEASSYRLEPAKRIAEAALDLHRARAAKIAVVNQLTVACQVSRPQNEDPNTSQRLLGRFVRAQRKRSIAKELAGQFKALATMTTVLELSSDCDRSLQLVGPAGRLIRELFLLDRDERRALSRFKYAVREFDSSDTVRTEPSRDYRRKWLPKWERSRLDRRSS
jgi:hypothetical protein